VFHVKFVLGFSEIAGIDFSVTISPDKSVISTMYGFVLGAVNVEF
jgi:hypothetical protein